MTDFPCSARFADRNGVHLSELLISLVGAERTLFHQQSGRGPDERQHVMPRSPTSGVSAIPEGKGIVIRLPLVNIGPREVQPKH